jgi:hypothetical protein
LRAALREYSITFAAQVDSAASAIERRATDAAVKRTALVWRLRAIPEMRQACFRPEPIAALFDAWIFALQMDQFFRNGAGADVFGSLQPEALEVSERLVEQLTSLSHQARIYLAELPRQVRGEIDLLRADVLPPEQLSSMQNDLHVSATAAGSIAATVATIPGLVRDERSAVLEEVSRERALVLTAISNERERAIGAMTRAFALERELLMRDLDTQRRATLEWATAERREAIAEVRRELSGATDALRSERTIVVNDMRAIVDMVLLRIALGIVVAVVLTPLVAHAYARVWPRRH